LPISTVVAIGWREVLQPIQGAITGFLVAVLAVSLTITGLLSNDLAKWPILALSLIAAVLLLQPLLLAGTDDRTLGRLPPRVETFAERPLVARVMSWLRVVAWSIPFALLFVLNLSIPFVYIIPQLRP
jgi:hypothetical protein